MDDLAVKNFRDYLRIKSVHPNVDYAPCVEFLKKQAASLDLTCNVYEFCPKKPTLIVTWLGSDPQLPSILLSGHMDVVTVDEAYWTHPPFAAHLDEETGNIYARGAQDMKSVSIQYLEAIRRLKSKGLRLVRTINVAFTSDEEIGGFQGMGRFVQSPEFKALNVGFALDEGSTSPSNDFTLYYGERAAWQIWVKCRGPAGHGMNLVEGTSGETLGRVIQSFMKFKDAEKKKLEDSNLRLGEITTVNLTQVEGGSLPNVIPAEMRACFDIRIDNHKDHGEFENLIKKWCQEAGKDVTVEFVQKNDKSPITGLTDDNVYWKTFETTTKTLGLTLDKVICPGLTDMRFVRNMGVPALGFSPINNTDALLHNHNEYLNKDVFLKGIAIYEELITALGNLGP